MGISTGFNNSASVALRNLNKVSAKLGASLDRMSSGYKLNKSSEGSTELMISENLRSQIRGNSVAKSNVQMGLSMLNTADGATGQIADRLQRAREVALAVSSDTASADDLSAAQNEIQAIYNEIDQIANGTNYNEEVLLDGSIANMNIQIGSETSNQRDIAGAFQDATATGGLGVAQTTIGSAADAQTIVGEVDTALTTLQGIRATIGQYQNEMTNQMEYLDVANENLGSAEAIIRNTDIAQETANMARWQIQQQAAVSALAQANQGANVLFNLL